MKRFLLLLLILYCGTAFSQYNEKDVNEYINNFKELAIQKMYQYKIPASITLSQGIFESACGKSKLAITGNNHFGIKCHKEWFGDTLLIDDDSLGECFRKYITVEDSYTDHALFLTTRPRYSGLFTLDIMDYKAWAKGLKTAGYATNPQYAERLINLIEKYNISKQDTICMKRILSGDFNTNLSDKNVELKEIKPSTSEQKSGSIIFFSAKNNDFPTDELPFTERKVYVNNRSFFIIAEVGDSYAKIAKDVQDSEKNIRKYNDAKNGIQPREGEVIYIESKAKSNPTQKHSVAKGETLRYISQKYAIQLHYLFKYNNLDEKSIIKPGDIIKLKH